MTDTPEFSRRIGLDTLGAGAASHAIEADAAERAALAERFGLKAIERLIASAEVRRDGKTVYARGHVDARVTQSCVVTDEPVDNTIDADFDLRFVPEEAPQNEEEIELSAEECETLVYEGGGIDLGEAVAQTMALELDPFPRSENAPTALKEAGVISEEEAGPFGALKGLRDALAAKNKD